MLILLTRKLSCKIIVGTKYFHLIIIDLFFCFLNETMNILFVGAAIPNELCGKYKGCSVAGNKMQLGIIQSLSRRDGCNIQVLSTYPIAAYPKESVLGMRGKIFWVTSKIRMASVSFINLFVLKQITQAIGITLEIIRWRTAHKSEKNLILCFNACTERSIPVILVSQIYKIHKICIVADLPTNIKQHNIIKQIANYLQKRTSIFALRKFDGLIVLNEEAQKRYAPKLPFCIIDGGINLKDFTGPVIFGGTFPQLPNLGKRVILYSGALTEYNGIPNLIKAIKRINAGDVIFKFYGGGPLTQLVRDESKTDERIQYGGLVSNGEIVKIQRESSFLINPRPTSTLLSLITFPSKILEYMMSGTPILTTRLNSLVNEYKDLLLFINDDPIGMANDIDQALKIDEKSLVTRSKLAYQYVKENKSWEAQSKVIYVFLHEIINLNQSNSQSPVS